MSIGQKIRMEAKKQHLNFKQLALKAGMPCTSFYSILKRNSQRVSAVSLYKIAKALGNIFLKTRRRLQSVKHSQSLRKRRKKPRKRKNLKKFSH